MSQVEAKKMVFEKLERALFKRTEILFFIVFFVASLLFVPKFNNPQNLYNILVQSTELIILTCGMTFVFINAGIDFSVTAVLPLASTLGAMIMKKMENSAISIPLAIVTMLLIGLAIGCINGFAVTRLKMPSFIATMATQLVFSGIALTITQSSSIGGIPTAFNNIAQSSFLGIKIPLYIAAAVALILWYVLNSTVYGREVVSVGTNQKTSLVSGLPVKRIIFSLFVISGLCSAIASIIMTARLGAGSPSLGKDYLMDVVAAIVIGGTSVSGGKGNITGGIFGSILVVMLGNSLNLLDFDWYYITACKGFVILAVALLEVLRRSRALE